MQSQSRKGGLSGYDKGGGVGGGGMRAAHTRLQRFVAALLKVTASREEQTSPWRSLVFF